MFNPLLIIGFFILIDFIVSYFSKKEVNDTDIPTNQKNEKRGNSVFEMFAEWEAKLNESMEQTPRKTEALKEETPVQREGGINVHRADLIKAQEDKISKHSDMEKSRRTQRDQMLKSSRLSDQQVTLASQAPKRYLEDYDLDKQRKVSIETTDLESINNKNKINRTLNIKEDILKAVVYSEILKAPKSLEKK